MISLHTALYLSLSFVFLILNKLLFSPFITSFCRKSLHSHLSLTPTNTDQNLINPKGTRSKSGVLGVFTPANALESTATVFKPPPIGFIDDIGGGVDGLMSCTESLGFESSDERRADDESELSSSSSLSNISRESCDGGRRRRRRRTEAKKFPPPISSLDRNGRPSFFLRPVRRDGRLELSEVRIKRPPEILRVYRGDGRLRLDLVRDDNGDDRDRV